MKLNVGDNLLCKKHLKIYVSNPLASEKSDVGFYTYMIKQKNYKVYSVDYVSNFIYFEYSGIVFNLLGMFNEEIDSKYHLWDYFYTEKELRKQKLDEIEEIKGR